MLTGMNARLLALMTPLNAQVCQLLNIAEELSCNLGQAFLNSIFLIPEAECSRLVWSALLA